MRQSVGCKSVKQRWEKVVIRESGCEGGGGEDGPPCTSNGVLVNCQVSYECCWQRADLRRGVKQSVGEGEVGGSANQTQAGEGGA